MWSLKSMYAFIENRINKSLFFLGGNAKQLAFGMKGDRFDGSIAFIHH